MAPQGPSARMRHRKVNLKSHLSVIRESDLPEDERLQLHSIGADDGDGIESGVQRVETGVDKDEEKEHHLQAVINASAAAAKDGHATQIYIPTPDAVKSSVPYNELYPHGTFAQPATYIRFSSTVEDCIGVPYCMDERDDTYLCALNDRASALREKMGRCEEYQFEVIMNSFEETSTARQPFANLDGTPVLGFDELQSAFDDTVDPVAKAYAKDIYKYWKERKVERGMQSIIPHVKTLNMDRADNVDDSDPYFCFRRRETRQVRKTRGRDAQIIEKLKKLRKELEEGRQLLHWVKNREEGRKEDLRLSRQIYEQRAAVREMKRTLDIKDTADEELLINQKSPKRRMVEMPQQARQQQILQRQNSISLPEFDLKQFTEKLEQRHRETQDLIQGEMKAYAAKNNDFVDRTQDFLQGYWAPQDDLEDVPMSGWVSLNVQEIPHYPQQEPTPPASVLGDGSGNEDEDAPKIGADEPQDIICWASPPASTLPSPNGADPPNGVFVRQRRGRGGRLMLDRRILKGRQKKLYDSRTAEAYKYDIESGDDEEDDGHDYVDPQDAKFFRLKQHLDNVNKLQRAAGMNRGRGRPNGHGPSLNNSRVQMS